MNSITRRLAVAVSVFCMLSASGVARAQMQTKSQIKCITSSNDSVSKLAKSQLGLQRKCLKAAAYGTLPMGQDMADCVAADADGKVAAQVSKAATKDAKACPSGLADFAYTSSATATTAGINAANGAYEDVAAFGDSGAILSADAAPDGAKCQDAIAKAASRLLLATLAEFRACKKAGLSDGSITSTVQLGNQCFDAVSDDLSGKIAAARLKLADTYTAKCAEVVQSTVIPGVCAGASDVAACIAGIAKCRTCQAFNAADNLVRGCDQFDDGVINDSCETSTVCDDDDGDTYGENCAAGEDCNDINPNVNPGEVEVCNGVDDDCNDFVDDSPSGTGGSCGTNSVPPCMLGTTQCVNGVLECVGNVEPTAETCNDIDDDCNGAIDDSPSGTGGTCGASGVAPCMLGTTQCVDGALDCVGDVGPVDETCNDIDDDCNGTTDDSPLDAGGTCGTSSVAPCMLGTTQCVDGGLDCVGEVEPTAEVCNGIDDDCNGDVDDSAPCDMGLTCQGGMCLP
jgi:hypothetical protein